MNRPIVVRPWWLVLAAFDFFMVGYSVVHAPWLALFFVIFGVHMLWPTAGAAEDYARRYRPQSLLGADAMTPPDRLVQAAAEAPCLGAGKVNTGLLRGVVSCEGRLTKHPECALAAAFAALPECREAVEVLADVEHNRWSRWMWWTLDHGVWNEDGSFTINAERAQRWHRLADTDYADVDDETQEHDRVEARTSLAAIAKLADDA